MATKKASKKKAARKTAKKSKSKKAGAKRSVKKRAASGSGNRYECTVCGLAVTVDQECGCIESCDIVCCGEQMRPA
ncbi:MAG: hypothetical protein ACM34I_05160 [bacterium]